MLEFIILAFLNMSETFDFSPKFLFDIGAATLGGSFAILLVLSIVYLGYRTSTNIQGQTNIIMIPVFTILAMIVLGIFVPALISYLLLFIAFTLSAASIAWKLFIKKRGEP